MKQLKPLDEMTSTEEAAFLVAFGHDDGAAASNHLAKGQPVYCVVEDTPEGVIEKLYPDGRRQYVRFDQNGEHVV